MRLLQGLTSVIHHPIKLTSASSLPSRANQPLSSSSIIYIYISPILISFSNIFLSSISILIFWERLPDVSIQLCENEFNLVDIHTYMLKINKQQEIGISNEAQCMAKSAYPANNARKKWQRWLYIYQQTPHSNLIYANDNAP